MLQGTGRSFRATLAGLALLAACAPFGARSGAEPVAYPPAPEGMSADAWLHARTAYQHAREKRLTDKTIVTIIDYSLPSSEPRLWVVDLATSQVLMNEYVAHGSGSGGLHATAFSNRFGSRESSLGTFITASSYRGIRGLSVRLRGMERGINDRAMARGLVIHGTPNVSAERARRGRLGRTEGCPAVSPAAARRLVRLIANGTVVFAWYPEKVFLTRSEFLDRSRAPVVLTNLE